MAISPDEKGGNNFPEYIKITINGRRAEQCNKFWVPDKIRTYDLLKMERGGAVSSTLRRDLRGARPFTIY